MKHAKKTVLASAISLCLSGGTAMAAGWTVIQDFTVNSNSMTMTQTQGSNGAAQTMNSINLGAGGDVASGEQNVNMSSGATLGLTQNVGTTDSEQAVNSISAETVTSATQKLEVTGNVTLFQDTTGTDNVQAVNNVEATDAVTTSTQEVLSGDSVIFGLEQTGDVGVDNTQALNRLELSNSNVVGSGGTVTQDITAATGGLELQQSTGSNGVIQAGNLIEADSTSDTVTQAIDVSNISFNQSATGAGHQLGNGLVLSDVTVGGTMDQDITVTTVAFTQSGAIGSIQSGNYVGK
jgi:hypothetical protein